MTEDLDNEYIIKKLFDNDIQVEISGNQYQASFFVDGKKIELFIALDECFPYEFPKVYYEGKTENHLKGVPHVNSDTTICCFDESKSFPNPLEPNDVIISCFLQAKNTIISGIKGTNKEDFLDEFSAYWNNMAKSEFYLLSELPTKCKALYYNLCDWCSFVSISKNTLKEKLEELGVTGEDADLYKGLYVPLDKAVTENPKTHQNINDIVKNNSHFYEDYCSFLEREGDRGHLIIMSFEHNNSLILFGVLHKRITKLDGFRRGHVPLQLSLAHGLGNVNQKEIVGILKVITSTCNINNDENVCNDKKYISFKFF